MKRCFCRSLLVLFLFSVAAFAQVNAAPRWPVIHVMRFALSLISDNSLFKLEAGGSRC